MRLRPIPFLSTISTCLLLLCFWVLSAAASSTLVDTELMTQVEGQSVRVGIDPFFPPFASLDDDGNIVGFQVALFEAIADDAGFDVEWVVMPVDDLFSSLENGDIDALVATMFLVGDRVGSASLSDVYYLTTQSVYISPDVEDEIDGLKDLNGRRIGIEIDTMAQDYVNGIEDAEVTEYDDLEALIDGLEDGEVEAIIADTLRVDRMMSEDEINIVALDIPVVEDGYSFVINPAVDGLLDAVNTSLDNIIVNNMYNTIYREWFNAPPPSQFHLPAAAAETLVNATFTGDLETLAAVTCDRYERGDEFPTAEDMSGVEELGFDGIELVYDASVEGNSAQVTVSGTFQFLGAERNAAELFDGPLEMILEDGSWVFCPSDS